ncbi:hypothetical protein H7I41_03410 [Mycobacterium manitobense]|uniref:Uncharacterized protein n=1 Tax=[Mycobacterium] manitobense TaxID=190147 RepID=A0A9X2YJM5_9MYCO|nr:hypothetical protein [[Mycobacterium] manitobense]MCV7168969.1 hypothetical protein [[Mycobacterium] manitobense]
MADIRSEVTALFGAIDELVVEADADPGTGANADIVDLAERLLPNTTGLGRQGWFQELQEFFGSDAVRNPRSRYLYSFPSAEDARANLNREPNPDRVWNSFQAKEDRHPALARAAFALVAWERLNLLRHGRIDETVMTVLPGLLDPWPVEPTVPRPGRRDAVGNAEYLLERIERIQDRESWIVLAGEAVSEQFAKDSSRCFGTLEDAGGQYCSTLYTECCDDDVTVDQVKAIIHPANWHLCYPKFFHSMTKQQPYFTSDGWWRILEEISAEPEFYTLKTALIFSLEDDRDKGFYINYQLDPNRQGEDKCIGIVEIDNGYLWVTPKNADGTGVRVRTSKEERVNGLSPTATAALGCQLGWGDSAYEMIIAAARNATNGDFNPNKKPVEGWPMGAQSKQPVDTGPNVIFPPVPATLPINAADAIKDGACLLKSLIRRVSSNTGDAASRWLDGTVKTDVEEVTTQMGKDLKAWSLEVYEKAERNVKPPKDVTP